MKKMFMSFLILSVCSATHLFAGDKVTFKGEDIELFKVRTVGENPHNYGLDVVLKDGRALTFLTSTFVDATQLKEWMRFGDLSTAERKDGSNFYRYSGEVKN